MVDEHYVPTRGDIVWLDFDPQSGYEQKGRRPAITISPKEYNEKVGLGLFCPITSKIKMYPFEVELRSEIKTKGVVLSDQIKSFDWRYRNAEFIESVPKEITNKIQELLALLIW